MPKLKIALCAWKKDGVRRLSFSAAPLAVGQTFSGPALVLQEDATTYVAPGWNVRVDAHANLILQAVPK